MPLILSEEQTMLHDSAREFLAEQAPVSQLRALRDTHDADGFSRPLWREFASMGFTGVLVPEAHGGLGLGHVEAGAHARTWLRTKANSIEGGTSEVQLNIIAKRLLELPGG